jgi:hypothetical protein
MLASVILLNRLNHGLLSDSPRARLAFPARFKSQGSHVLLSSDMSTGYIKLVLRIPTNSRALFRIRRRPSTSCLGHDGRQIVLGLGARIPRARRSALGLDVAAFFCLLNPDKLLPQ